MANRTPGAYIRKVLREEVNYGCPICRSPFLDYHHFDPPWEPKQIHNISGMIAMCPSHHAQADVGTWTNDELRKMKRTDQSNSISGKIHWSLHNTIVIAGRNMFTGKNISFTLLGHEVLRLKEIEPDVIALNALIFNENMQPVLRIDENDIILAPKLVSDFNCKASANCIRVDVKDSKSFFEIKFTRRNYEYVISQLDEEIQNENEVTSIIKSKAIDDMISIIETRFCMNTKIANFQCMNPYMIFDFHKWGYKPAKFSGRFFGDKGCLSWNLIDNKSSMKIDTISIGNKL